MQNHARRILKFDYRVRVCTFKCLACEKLSREIDFSLLFFLPFNNASQFAFRNFSFMEYFFYCILKFFWSFASEILRLSWSVITFDIILFPCSISRGKCLSSGRKKRLIMKIASFNLTNQKKKQFFVDFFN